MVNELEWTEQHAGKLAVNIQEISWTIHYSVDIFFSPAACASFCLEGFTNKSLICSLVGELKWKKNQWSTDSPSYYDHYCKK